jgi:hypothetical protein
VVTGPAPAGRPGHRTAERGPNGGDARDRGGRRMAARFLLVCRGDQAPAPVGRRRGSLAGAGRREARAGEPGGGPGPADRRRLPGHHPRSRGQGPSHDHTTDAGAAVVRCACRCTGGHRPGPVRAAGACRREAACGPGRGAVRGGGGDLRQRCAGQVGPVRAGGAGRGQAGRAHPAAAAGNGPGPVLRRRGVIGVLVFLVAGGQWRLVRIGPVRSGGIHPAAWLGLAALLAFLAFGTSLWPGPVGQLLPLLLAAAAAAVAVAAVRGLAAWLAKPTKPASRGR